jgi:hypothetical protein
MKRFNIVYVNVAGPEFPREIWHAAFAGPQTTEGLNEALRL